MPDDQYAAYRDYLREGVRIEVGIPLSGGGIFRDWAIIQQAAGDELLAQISRDVLPANVRVDEGFILDVSVWVKTDVYTCSGIVVERFAEGRQLRIRLFGEFTLRERRQFFRSYLELRLKYARAGDVSRQDLQNDWERRKDLEQMKFQGYDDFVIAGHKARYHPVAEFQWRDLPWSEVNLGGGGICLRLREPVQTEELLALEISLPLTPPRQVHAVAQVIYVMPLTDQKGEEIYRAGMQFLFLDERDRDLIFRLISVTQIQYLRNAAENREPRELEQPAATESGAGRQARNLLLTLLFLLLACYVIWSVIRYQRSAPPNEIQNTYEKAIRQYRHQEK